MAGKDCTHAGVARVSGVNGHFCAVRPGVEAVEGGDQIIVEAVGDGKHLVKFMADFWDEGLPRLKCGADGLPHVIRDLICECWRLLFEPPERRGKNCCHARQA